MAYSDYERLRDALRSELELWPPSEQDYQTSLVKAKMHSGLSRIRLSQPQKDALYQIYVDARDAELATQGRK